MTDYTGTDFCDDCASDAFESGLFDTEPNFYSRMTDEFELDE